VTGTVADARRIVTTSAVAFCMLCVAAFALQGPLCDAAAAIANPSPPEIRAKLHDAAVTYGIPPKILYGIAYQESTWRQFDANGDPLVSRDGGIGLMQVTSYGNYDVERLKTDIDYNITAGAEILGVKWQVTPVIGDGSKRCYENWFYAVWAYNGWVANNPYPYKVWGHVAAGPSGWWTGLAVTPVPPSSLVNGFGVRIPTPLPAHFWSPTPLPKPTLTAPRAPSVVAAGARFAVSGTLSPAHPAGTHSVQIRCYRASGSAWMLRRTVPATNQDADGATRYVARFALGKAGRWRICAYAPADAEHAAASSVRRSVTVR
jgi:hypothetical protein